MTFNNHLLKTICLIRIYLFVDIFIASVDFQISFFEHLKLAASGGIQSDIFDCSRIQN